mgnify:CR=1 FL=1
MLKKSKTISFMLILVLLFVFTSTACQQSGTTDKKESLKNDTVTTSNSSGSTSATSKFMPIEGKKYKINWLSRQAQPVDNDAPLVKYWNEKFNVELNIINVPDTNALNVKIAAGDIPDTLTVAGYDNYVKLAEDGVIAELTDEILKTVSANLYVGLAKEVPGYWEENKLDGKLYGIPGVNFWNPYRQPIAWRGDWLENVGIAKVPSTLEEVEDALYKFARNDPDKNGKDDTYGCSMSGLDIIYSAYGYFPSSIFWHEKDGKVVPGLTQPEVKEALSLINKMYKDKVIDPEFVTGENQGGYWALTQPFINGRIGLSCFATFYHWGPGTADKNFVNGGANWDALYKVNPAAATKLILAEPIKGNDGKQRMPSAGGKYTFAYTCIGKHVADNEPDKLGKILQIWDATNASDAETLATAIYGFKGEQWNYEDNTIPRRVEGRTPQDDIKFGGNTLMFSQPLISVYSAAYPENFIVGNNYGFKVGKLDNAVIKPLPSAQKYSAELEKKRAETFIAIITGEKPIDYFDDFVKDWLKNGGEQLVKEANEIYASSRK